MNDKSSAARPPSALLAELTYRCPLACPYCSNPLHMERARNRNVHAKWRDIFSQAAALGVLHVHLSGGEPASRRDLRELVAHCAKVGLYTNLITSGVGLTRELFDELAAAGLDHVQLSIQDAEADRRRLDRRLRRRLRQKDGGRRLGRGGRPAAHRQCGDPSRQCRRAPPKWSISRSARRAANRDRPHAILRLGAAEPRPSDADARAERKGLRGSRGAARALSRDRSSSIMSRPIITPNIPRPA